jgi:hypothetical protein
MEDSDRGTDSNEDTTWESNPLPLMTKHPPRVTTSNTKIHLDREGILSQTCPKRFLSHETPLSDHQKTMANR